MTAKATLAWIAHASGRSDWQRAKDTAPKLLRWIRLWEQIRQAEEWTPISALITRRIWPGNGNAHVANLRYARRFVYGCAAAGLIELSPARPGRVTEFRLTPKGRRNKNGGPPRSARRRDQRTA